MYLTIKCKRIDTMGIDNWGSSPLFVIGASGVDNADDIIESLVDECDPASLVTSGNKDGILDYIGIEYVMKYFDLKQEKEDYGMRDGDFI